MNEQLLKTSGADVSSSRKKHRKTLGVWHPLSIVSVLSLNPVRKKINKLLSTKDYVGGCC